MPSAGGLIVRTNVPFWLAPVTIASNVSPMSSLSSSAAAVLRTVRSTLFSASSRSVQCSAIVRELVVRVRRAALIAERRLHEPLRHEIGVAAVGRGGVRVVVRREPEVAARILARQIERVDARVPSA